MNYDDMLQMYKDNLVSLIVVVLDVFLKEVSCFGIMNIDLNDCIVEFEEKFEYFKLIKVLMGIYIFDWKRLWIVLIDGEKNGIDMLDFGKNVILVYFELGECVYIYNFDGYWKDVGIIEFFWEVNMEYIGEDNKLYSCDCLWKIYFKNLIVLFNFMIEDVNVKDFLVVDGCFVVGNVEYFILLINVQVKLNVIIKDFFVMSGVIIGEGVKIN